MEKKHDSTKMKLIFRGIYKQIAEEKNLSENAVKQAIRRGHWELCGRYAEILKQRKAAKEAFEKAIKEVA